MLRQVLIALSESQRARAFVLGNPLARRSSRRFVAGETLDEAVSVVEGLRAQGFRAALNHLGERTTSPREAEGAAQAYEGVLARLRGRNEDCYVSVKLTQLGLDLGADVALGHMRRIVDVARADGRFVRIDMEHSQYVDDTIAIIERLRAEGYDNLGAVIQSYLYRSADDVERLVGQGVRIRLCKGAYAEPARVAYPRKRDVDASFLRLAQRLLRDSGYHAIATHDERLVKAAMEQARSDGKPPEGFEFQMIYGIRRDLQAWVRDEGYTMRVYVPYGREWYPYLMRRMAERPANLLFILRNLLRR